MSLIVVVADGRVKGSVSWEGDLETARQEILREGADCEIQE